MANKPLDMKKLHLLIHLYTKGVSIKQISRQTGIARNTVKKYVFRFMESKLTIQDFKSLSDDEIYDLFECSNTSKPLTQKLKDMYEFFPYMEKELKKTGITKHILWEEYFEKYPDGYRRSMFKTYFNPWQKQSNPVMRIPHKAGDKMYVDYAGKHLEIINKETGEIQQVEVFVAILGASQYTYVEASVSQKKEDFIKSCENALHFFEGVPSAIVSDNLKSAVTKSSKYEPILNETFEDFVLHYETCAIPARAYKPKDKALVENAVKIAYQTIYARLRKQSFFCLEELNNAIQKELKHLNRKPLTGRVHSRKDLFDALEKLALKPLPKLRYEMKQFAKATVMQNGHVCLTQDKHYYSVPNHYIRKKVKIIYSQSEVEIYYRHQRIAFHKRDETPYQ